MLDVDDFTSRTAPGPSALSFPRPNRGLSFAEVLKNWSMRVQGFSRLGFWGLGLGLGVWGGLGVCLGLGDCLKPVPNLGLGFLEP